MTFAARGPAHDSWVVSVHHGDPDSPPVGTGFVVARDRVLTCDHVVRHAWRAGERLWVVAPKAGRSAAPQIAVLALDGPDWVDAALDVALLRLAEEVPAGLVASLRLPEPEDLVGTGWWAFGFPNRDPLGNSAAGTVGVALGDGWLRLDTQSRYPVRTGFSGAAVWSAQYAAVVGVIGQANPGNGDARALTLAQVARAVPAAASALWAGWSLRHDPEARHWLSRARGVGSDAERGFRFRGRTAALTEITGWLEHSTAREVLVVTGSPGVGKSAVLSRVVTTADPESAATLPPEDTAVRARPGLVACAVHAKGKTALELAHEIARAASARLPDTVEELAPALRTALGRRGAESFPLVIDALDEAAGPQEARAIAAGIALPLAQTCADLGVRVVVGSRPRDASGDLLAAFGPAARQVALDTARYFEEWDLVEYAVASLRLVGDERQASPYAEESAARPAAQRIAELARGNFLIAGLVARTHGLYDEVPVTPEDLAIPSSVHAALREYAGRIPDISGVAALDVLTILAYARTPGLPLALWHAALEALYPVAVDRGALTAFAHSAAANFLIESNDAGLVTVYQLFHQALGDALLAVRADLGLPEEDEQAFTWALLTYGQRHGWAVAPPYLLCALPAHAARTGLLDELLAEDAYPLHADLGRLVPEASRTAFSPAARDRARLLRLTPAAAAAEPGVRAAMFSVTELQEHLGDVYRRLEMPGVPYRAVWSDISPRLEHAVLAGHTGSVRSLCAVATPEGTLLASSSWDGTVRIWDPLTGTARHTLHGGSAQVCAFTLAGRPLLAGIDVKGPVRVWDPISGAPYSVLDGHTGWGLALCPVKMPGDQALLVSSGTDGTVRVWEPSTGEALHVLHGAVKVDRLYVLPQPGRSPLLAGIGDDRQSNGTVSVWDPRSGELVDRFAGQSSAVALALPGGTALAYYCDYRTVRLWDPVRGQLPGAIRHHRSVAPLCAIEVPGRALLTTVESTREGVCVITVPDPSRENIIRVWDMATETLVTSIDCAFQVDTLHTFPAENRVLLAGVNSAYGGRRRAGGRGLRVWDPLSGELLWHSDSDGMRIDLIHSVPLADRVLLATAGNSHIVRLWDPLGQLSDPARAVDATADLRAGISKLHRIRAGDRELLAVLNRRYSSPEASYPAASNAELLDPESGRRVATK